jgi:hypothetical protein
MTLNSAKGERLRFPTPEEMLAIERAARLARAQAIARLLAATGRHLIRRADTLPRDSSQFPTERKTMTTSTMTTLFWKDALASLPSSVQRRYAASFEAAESFENLLDQGIQAWGSAKRGLAQICRVTARAMRGTARILDSAARRLPPAHS